MTHRQPIRPRPVSSVSQGPSTGDGAFGFNAMEIDTAVRHNLDVVIVIGSDGVWGIDYHQQVQLYGRAVATELDPVRYDKMAEALGAHGEYVEKPEDIKPALERAFASGKPAIINIVTERFAGSVTQNFQPYEH